MKEIALFWTANRCFYVIRSRYNTINLEKGTPRQWLWLGLLFNGLSTGNSYKITVYVFWRWRLPSRYLPDNVSKTQISCSSSKKLLLLFSPRDDEWWDQAYCLLNKSTIWYSLTMVYWLLNTSICGLHQPWDKREDVKYLLSNIMCVDVKLRPSQT